MREEVSIPPKELPDRRVSMTWKKFNLKRQLSKVNMKIGINMNNENESAPKSSSVFYTQKECSPEDSDQSPPKDPPVAVGVECRESMTESTIGDSIDAQSESLISSEDKEELAAATTTTESLFETVHQTAKKVDFANETNDGNQNSRPNNLPLSSVTTSGTANEGIPPTRPPRQKSKEKRDQRLLSVPNIKYQMRDMRSRTSRNDSSPSFSGAGGGGGSGGGGGVVVGGNVTKKTRKYSHCFH